MSISSRIKNFVFLYSALAIITAIAMMTAMPRANAANHHVLMPGEKVKITVMYDEELSQTYQIDDDGMILMSYLGKVPVAGRTAREVETLIATQLQDGYINNPIISVTSLQENIFYILGAVNAPGQYNLPRHSATILNAVALAGGFTPHAHENKFEIIRTDKNGEKIRHKKMGALSEIIPGDIIVVEESFF